MNSSSSSSFFSAFQSNTGYADEMYALYQIDPTSVEPEWKSYFDGFQDGFSTAATLSQNVEQYEHLLGQLSAQQTAVAPFAESLSAPAQSVTSDILFELKVANLVQAWKMHGHLQADINPLQPPQKECVSLTPAYHNLSPSDLKKNTHAGMLAYLDEMPLEQLLEKLKARFAGSVGAEIEHVENGIERQWLHEEFCGIQGQVNKETQEKIYLELAKADALEKTIATKYIGKKRFSIEGADAQLPACESFLDESARLGVEECVVAIAHRGRLNFLVHVIGKPLEKLLAEWEGYPHGGLVGDCDVKYHYGYESERLTRSGQKMRISMPFNPSHLEYVGCVGMGDVRARQDYYHQSNNQKVAYILFHGDAAIAGQGTVYESAQMMTLPGYQIGGTVHVVANNQVGFTTDPTDARSSTYCTSIAKVTNSPVFHVNADDVDALHNVMSLAARYRARFKKDVYIDLICFRRYGHNEADEPTFTQPLLYKLIKEKRAPFEEYAQYLINKHSFTEAPLKETYTKLRAQMNDVFDRVKAEHKPIEQFKPARDAGQLQLASEAETLASVPTQFPLEKLIELAKNISTVPESFHVNSKLARIVVAERAEMAQGRKKIDWGTAELLAYATLLSEGYRIRLVGEDAQRGTFAHRHGTLIDAENGTKFTALKSVSPNVEIINSLLSEEAALGYEYGYAIRHARALVLWEAQFGDFVNGAQVILDQFLASGESKWCQTQALVLLLPHGMEGQGAEHSSARLERFLQLCAAGNMQVCYFTNGAQLYHALRRQMVRNFRKPLVLMTPKSFLRSPRAATTLTELAQGEFHEILDDKRIQDPKKVERVILCTGKISLDLFDALEKPENAAMAEKVAIIRVEQLYPLHTVKMVQILTQFKQAKIFAWAQEEPANMGAWSFIRHEMEEACAQVGITKLHYFGRSRRASPAVGIEKQHVIEQTALIQAILEKNTGVEI